jgi:hypothetical protein
MFSGGFVTKFDSFCCYMHLKKKLSSQEDTSPNVIRVIQSRRIRWEWHVIYMGRREMCTGFWWVNPRETGHLEDLGIDRG